MPQRDQIVYLLAESLRITGILLQPFIPDKAEEALNRLGVDPLNRTFKQAKFHLDSTYGERIVPPEMTGLSQVLFPALPVED